MTHRTRALTTLVAGALALPFLGSPAAAAPPPAEQDITVFCTNPTSPQFADVAPGDRFALAIRCIATAGITTGGPEGLPADRYGPDRGVSRGQMATFVANMITAADARDRNQRGASPASQIEQLPPYDGRNRFTDVATSSAHVSSINRLAAAGIALGGPAGRPATSYAPGELVSRAQMATFLNRAVAFAQGQDPADAGAGAGYTAPANTDYYDDDNGLQAHERNINGITSVGIAVGDGVSTYSPARATSRAQMAAFVSRTLSQLLDDDRIHSLLEVLSGHFGPESRADDQRTVVPAGGEAQLVLNTRELRAGFLNRLVEYRITLVRCENVVRGANDLLAVKPEGSTGLADAGAPSSRIIAVGTVEVQGPPPPGTTTSFATVPGANTSIQVNVVNPGPPECVIGLIYVNGGPGRTLAQGGTSPRLEVDAGGRPVEPFGVSGRTTFVAAP
jgi:hypothetical protein